MQTALKNTSRLECDSPLSEKRNPLVLHNITSVSDSISVHLCFSGMLQTAEELRVSVEALCVVSVFLSPHLGSDLRRNATATKMQVRRQTCQKNPPHSDYTYSSQKAY